VKPELFHAVDDGGESAKARAKMMEWGLEKRVRIRNVFYPEVIADLKAHGGGRTPALWDGEKLHEGADAVIARLFTLRGS
jgi:hypothetical protein